MVKVKVPIRQKKTSLSSVTNFKTILNMRRCESAKGIDRISRCCCCGEGELESQWPQNLITTPPQSYITFTQEFRLRRC